MGSLNYDFGTYPRTMLHSADLSNGAKLLYLMLNDHTTVNDPTCYPGKDRLCAHLSWSSHTLEKYTRELLDSGWISRSPRRGKDGTFRGWLYRVYKSPETTTDLAGGAMNPIHAAESAARQNLDREVVPQIFEAEPEAKQTYTFDPRDGCQKSDVCVRGMEIRKETENPLNEFKRSVSFDRKSEPAHGKGRAFTKEEQETIELTILRYESQGKLHSLPGLMRYFRINGVDTSCLARLKSWKAEQDQKIQMRDEVVRIDAMKEFQKHLFECKECREGKPCEQGRAVRPPDLTMLGCFGCPDCEISEAMAAIGLVHCRKQRAAVKNPLTYRCPNLGRA